MSTIRKMPLQIKRGRRPISRVDSGNTHGYFARVYRDDWVGNRSFADRRYGGKEKAKAAARRWVTLAEAALPIIPARPVMREATVTVYQDERRPKHLRYYQVYLPQSNEPNGEWKTEKLYFTTLDGQAKQREKAQDLVNQQNARLKLMYRNSLIFWKMERDQIIFEIERIWPEVKKMPV